MDMKRVGILGPFLNDVLLKLWVFRKGWTKKRQRRVSAIY